MNKDSKIRNSTAEFLIFTTTNTQDTMEVKVEDETVWLTQKLIAKLFDVNIPNINEHLQNIFKTNELEENTVIRNFRITASDGKNYNTKYYNLQDSGKVTAIIAKEFAISKFDKLLNHIDIIEG